jgi:Uma2 family endonuclease
MVVAPSTARPAAKLTTADQLLQMPNDGMRRELVVGELREMTPAGGEHGYITVELTLAIGFHVKKNGLGNLFAAETGFILRRDPDTVRAPDVAFMSKERASLAVRERGFVSGAPDLAVEVISPSDTNKEIEAEAEDWLRAGCRMVMLVNPRSRSLKIYRSPSDVSVLGPNDAFDGADVLPGFQLPVNSIFGEE